MKKNEQIVEKLRELETEYLSKVVNSITLFPSIESSEQIILRAKIRTLKWVLNIDNINI
jgi:hypothetical protein